MSDRNLDQDQRHPDADLLLDVALGQADLPTRHDVGSHLVVCPRCRSRYDELAGAIEQVLAAVPRVAPPPNFEVAVLARLDERRRGSGPTTSGSDDVNESPVASPPRRRTHRWLVPVAAGLIGIAGGAGLTAVVLQNRESQTVSAGTPIVTGDGARVGSVTRTIARGEPALVVAVDDGPVGVSYTCRLVLEDGSIQDVGEWKLHADGVNSWVVTDPGARRVELIAGSGRVWSSADL